MQSLQLSGEKKYGKATIKVDVPVMLFEEEKTWFAYMPSFDLTGYGNNTEEAKESLKIILDEFIRYSLNKKTFFDELKRLGWEIKSKKRPIHAPKMSNLIQKMISLKILSIQNNISLLIIRLMFLHTFNGCKSFKKCFIKRLQEIPY